MDFVYAAELKKQYVCYGHFYELVFMTGDRARCRSVLEIVETSMVQDSPSEFSLKEPDAVVIMMNPGSSHPKDIYHIDEEISYPVPDMVGEKKLVLTQPDNTQYQIMRIAVEKGWRHIRVLNLSDLRDPKSGSFIEKTEALAGIIGGHVHSIFCEERAEECARSLKRNSDTPLLLGWGQDQGLLPLIEQCASRIKNEKSCAVPSEIHPLLNAHPSPMLQKKKVHWLECMLHKLESD